jgi:hypothetical protein
LEDSASQGDAAAPGAQLTACALVPPWSAPRCWLSRRRPSEGTANPRGGPNPFVSEDGAYTLVDVRFYEGFKLYGEDEQVRWLRGGCGVAIWWLWGGCGVAVWWPDCVCAWGCRVKRVQEDGWHRACVGWLCELGVLGLGEAARAAAPAQGEECTDCLARVCLKQGFATGPCRVINRNLPLL